MKQGVLIGAFALMSVVAVAGWMRKPEAPAPVYAPPAAGYQPQAYQPQPQPQAYAPLNQYGMPAQYASAPVAPVPYATTAVYQRPVVARPVVRRTTSVRRYTEPRRVVYKRKRPFTHSLAIVGGGAGAGAAIGALAGGGKGAGIGALAGGAAGLIYDRLTHNR